MEYLISIPLICFTYGGKIGECTQARNTEFNTESLEPAIEEFTIRRQEDYPEIFGVNYVVTRTQAAQEED